jgi:hypothetical protein
LLMPREPIRAPLGVNVPGFAMAGFQVTLHGRIWVTAEGMFEYLHGEGSLIIHASDDVMTVLVHDAKLSRPERSKQLDPETLRYRRTFHGSTACNSDALGPTKTAYPAAGLLGGRPLNLLFKRAGTSFLVIALMFPEFKPFWVTRRSEIFQDRRKSEGNTDFHAY